MGKKRVEREKLYNMKYLILCKLWPLLIKDTLPNYLLIMIHKYRITFIRFYRFKVRGIQHIIFYSLPNYGEFYLELVNLLDEAPVGGITCTVVYSHYDSLSLSRVVGTRQARDMLTSQDALHTMYSTK